MRFVRRILIFAMLFCCLKAFPQQKFTINGTITDASNGEVLSGVIVSINTSNLIAISNNYGFYSLSVPEGDYTVSVNLMGYQKQEQLLKIHNNQTINLSLKQKSVELEAVAVTGVKENKNITSNEMGNVRISPRQIENVPVLFGERDIIKTLQLLPGIKQTGEGNTGFCIRGGGIDQNLILLDEAPVYNASHLLGFFSVFNSEAIRDANLYKGSIPAEYGGRASSVLDIRMKEGNAKEYQTTGNIGLISSNISFEGPIKEDVSSFIVSGRRTYADLFLKLVPDKDFRDSKLYFYDLNLKTNFKLSNATRLFVSGYLGHDKFWIPDQFGFDWGSKTATVRLNHTFNKKIFSNSSFIFSNYSYHIDISGDNEVIMGSIIQDFNLKQDFSLYPNTRNSVKFGLNLIAHKTIPGEIEAAPGSIYKSLEVRPRRALEYSIYLSNNQQITNRLQAYYGIRLALFTNVGPGNFYQFDTSGNLTQQTSYNSFRWVKTQGGSEPRLAVNYQINEQSSIKGSYNRIYQFIHLLSNSTSSTPTDVWVPSSNNVKPQIADQWSVGYFRNFKKNLFESSLEVYYKNLQNQIDYKNGADLVFNSTVEAELVFGKGWAYGAELLFRKNYGRLTGWLGYTWSKTMRQFDLINEGKPFPARQDRRHDISVVAQYNLSKKLILSATWVYNTGNAVTFPNGKYVIDGRTVGYYTQRNGYRMPDYHRLDLGLTWIRRQTLKHESSWNFSIYNAYARENAYFISFRPKDDHPDQTEAVQISLFKFIPSISYKFKF
jgi:hypothetical protein